MTQAITLPLWRFTVRLPPALPYHANSIDHLCRQLDLSAVVLGLR